MENKYYRWITRPVVQSDWFDRYSGALWVFAPACCAITNASAVAVKALLVGLSLAVAAPSHAARRLREAESQNLLSLLLRALLTAVAFAVNGTIVALAAWVAVNAVQLLPTVLETPTIIVAIALLAAVAVVLVKVAISLFRTLLCTATEEQEELAVEPAVGPAVEPVVQSVVEEDAGADGEEEIEDLPFCQLFNISTEMVLLVDHVEMLPDETAFIRVVDEEGYTPLYKRRVRRDKEDKRYIAFNGEKLYLAPEKTKPTVNRKEQH